MAPHSSVSLELLLQDFLRTAPSTVSSRAAASSTSTSFVENSSPSGRYAASSEDGYLHDFSPSRAAAALWSSFWTSAGPAGPSSARAGLTRTSRTGAPSGEDFSLFHETTTRTNRSSLLRNIKSHFLATTTGLAPRTTSFASTTTCRKDYALPCPKGWCLAEDKACVAPYNWKGVCALRDHGLPKLSAEGKEVRGDTCDTPWPCEDDFAAHQARNIYCPTITDLAKAPEMPVAPEMAKGKKRHNVIVQIGPQSDKLFEPLQEGALEPPVPESPPEEKLVIADDGLLHQRKKGGPKLPMKGLYSLEDGAVKKDARAKPGAHPPVNEDTQKDFRTGIPANEVQQAVDALGGIVQD
ncbi:unnamed protein product [Amoebophrya sp. A120]|nr:unnamed protein product [Amoebophrya sp. A120]|eukprot:GSA120T00012670001.1